MATNSDSGTILQRIKAWSKRLEARAYRIAHWLHPRNLGVRLLDSAAHIYDVLKKPIVYLFSAVRNMFDWILELVPGSWTAIWIVLRGVLALGILAFTALLLWETYVFVFPRGKACDVTNPELEKQMEQQIQRGEVYLSQCWEQEDRRKFYTTHEGSLIIPYELIKHLERYDSEDYLLSAASLESLKMISLWEADFEPFSPAVDAHGVSPRSPKDWPLGFVNYEVETGGWKGTWFGVTCAGCHTGQIEYNVKEGDKFKTLRIRVDGAPAMADLNRFLQSLYYSLRETYCDGTLVITSEYANTGNHPGRKNNLCDLPPKGTGRDGKKFKRYASKVPDKTPTQVHGLLRVQVDAHDSWHERNDPPFISTDPPINSHGFGRLDAFGVIYNQLLNFSGNRESARSPNAPVSYPFLWDTSQHDWTQWNAISPRIPKGRNMGQVIGTFGKFEFPPSLEVVASIPLANLRYLQELVDKLRSPAWPERILGKLDPEKVKTGGAFYTNKCKHCHKIQERGMQLSRIDVHLADASLAGSLGTDPTMTFNAKNRKTQEPDGPIKIQSILLKTVTYVLGHPVHLFYGWRAPFEAIDTISEFTSPVAQCFVEYAYQVIKKRELRWKDCIIQDETKMFYKGRPLDGIWATAPYLHNGSVANLYELMLPQDERMTAFCVGSREFDPVGVGFETLVDSDLKKRNYGKSEADCKAKGLFWFNTGSRPGKEPNPDLKGNWNIGHEYGVKRCDIKDESCRTNRDKKIYEVIEYMKSL